MTKFEAIWGEHAVDRLQEVDAVLGSRDPTDEAYPNLRHWLENKLFAFHCSEFENTPILWQLTTERLGDGAAGVTGFSCLIDYHQLGADVLRPPEHALPGDAQGRPARAPNRCPPHRR